MIVEWKDIPGWEGIYQASVTGLIRSLDRIIVYKNGMEYSKTGRTLIPYFKDGYRVVSLSMKDYHKRAKKFKVARLVLFTFRGPAPMNTEACHNDGNRGNDKLSNLRWDTKAANSSDTQKHHDNLSGTKCSWSKVSDEALSDIRDMLAEQVPYRTIANKHGLSSSLIQRINNKSAHKVSLK